ncbi:hypothetical protein HDU67_001409 [Dinochytrium kinnereticum]|nr:hypothetical protein HDU67_001409 [Dinochytrium kinnereticum]
MANTVSEFLELLMAETLVDLDKLRSAAKHGVPDEVRGEVWKYLLGIENPNKANEISKRQAKHEEYRQYEREKENTEIMKRVRGEVSRYQRARGVKQFKSKDPGQTMENVLSTYLSYNRDMEYSASLVYLCGPFANVVGAEADVFYCHNAMMQRIDDYYSVADLNSRLSDFFMLFRTLIPELYNHFEEEEVDFKDWATSWFKCFLSKELPMDSILSSQKDNLEELEQSEIHAVLLKLPMLDMDKIINQALTIRDEVLERNLSEIASEERGYR